MAKIIVYLDSSDYSTLSNTSANDGELETIRADLLELANHPSVTFAFSGVHLAEISPLETQYLHRAISRADLLVDLCGRNALISIDRLFKAEITCLATGASTPPAVLSDNGIWYPEVNDTISPFKHPELKISINRSMEEKGMNRQSRRQANSLLYSGNKPRGLMTEFIKKQADDGDLTEVLKSFPMRPQAADVLQRYMCGQASQEEGEAAFHESLRDPRWMMRWFAEHHNELHPIISWVREPSQKMAKMVRKIATDALGNIAASDWEAQADMLVVDVANTLLNSIFPSATADYTLGLVEKYCPGLSITIRSNHSSIRDSLGIIPREPKDSDLADTLHAAYAPYVSIFRADKYMAPHIQKYVTRHGTKVVARLKDLPNEIRSQINNW